MTTSNRRRGYDGFRSSLGRSHLPADHFSIEPLEGRVLLADVTGALVEWQPLAVTFSGPSSSELNSAANPFLDFRLGVTFTHADTGRAYDVPGYFAGDGAGGGTGNRWRANFTPDEPGQWSYQASFRSGSAVAVSLDPNAGTATSFNGETGTFAVATVDPNAEGFLKWGRLEYVGGHYLKFRDGPYWLKAGADSPENFLGYKGFDNTPNAHHDYSDHIGDWNTGDPDWGGGRGKGIVGALNYLSEQRVNSIYLLPMNIGGDGRDTWPFPGTIATAGSASNDNLHYDISKLAQWETVFTHAQRKGIQLHIVLNEAEGANKKELDNGTLGVERKLYYREMVARFGHLNAVQWNISEEYDYKHPWTPDQVKEFAGYLQAVDPYDHPITVHNQADPDSTWTPFVGDTRFSATSLQYSGSVAGYGAKVEQWRARTAAAGRPIPIYMDELRSSSTSNEEDQRVELLWPTYMSGGSLEYYMGGLDTSLDNFRPFADLWTWTGHARQFFEQNLPYWEMTPNDGLLSGETSNDGGGQVFMKSGDVYAVYLPHATNSGTLNLTSTASGAAFEQRWFNPRSGKFEGSTQIVAGGKQVALGSAPSTASDDWVVLFRRSGQAPPTDPNPPTDPDPNPDPEADPTGPAVTRLVLIDADSDRDLMTLVNGQSIDFATLPTRNLNVRADVGTGVDYVIFGLDDDDAYATEGNSPYALAGDRSGDYREWTPSLGEHTLSATAYNSSDQPGSAVRVAFTVVNGNEGQPVTIAAPTNLTAVATSPSAVALNWVDNSDNEQSMVVERSVNGASFTPLITLSAGATEYVNEPVAADTLYAYRVRAAAGQVVSPYSNTAEVRTPANAPTAPAAPSGLTATATSSTSVSLAWSDQSTNETGFEIHRAVGTSTSWSHIASVGSNVRIFDDLQVVGGTSYAYRVISYNAGGESVPSNTATVTTPAPPTQTGPRVTGYTLFDAASQRNLGELKDGAVIDGAVLGTTQFNIRANVAGTVKSVRFAFDGNADYRTENEAPFALFGDLDGKFKPWSAPKGEYTLKATAFSDTKGRGLASEALTITFRIV